MQLANVLSLLGGLALFLYGMHMMSGGLEAAAGNRMKSIPENSPPTVFWALRWAQVLPR